MQQQKIIEDPGFAPSFSCYSSESITSRAVAKVIHENQDLDYKDFEFALVLSDKEANSQGWAVFKHDREITTSLGNLFIGDQEESSSYSSSSEADILDSLQSGTYCEWGPKERGGSSPVITKCKKSSSTGSGSKRWIFRFLLRRSNSECKGDSLKQKGNSGEVTKVGGRWKAQTPVHEQFYVQRRAENEFGKRKSYLPYRLRIL